MIDIDGIKAFSTVADTKSFSLAAHRLHLTQPAVSKRIALLPMIIASFETNFNMFELPNAVLLTLFL